MALSGIQIYKLLPQTNCKECGFPTCLAFAMKLAAKQVELTSCPYVSESSKTQLAESAAPPIRMISVKADGREVKAGNEVVLFRHDKTFYNKPGLFVEISDLLPEGEILALGKTAGNYATNYVGIDLKIDGFAVRNTSADTGKFAAAIKTLRQVCQHPLILLSADPAAAVAGLAVLSGEAPMIATASSQNWEELAALAKQNKTSLVVSGDSLDELADLTEKVKAAGVEDLVLSPANTSLGQGLTQSTLIRPLYSAV